MGCGTSKRHHYTARCYNRIYTRPRSSYTCRPRSKDTSSSICTSCSSSSIGYVTSSSNCCAGNGRSTNHSSIHSATDYDGTSSFDGNNAASARAIGTKENRGDQTTSTKSTRGCCSRPHQYFVHDERHCKYVSSSCSCSSSCCCHA